MRIGDVTYGGAVFPRLDEIDAAIPTGAHERFLARVKMFMDLAIAEMIEADRRGDAANGLRASGMTVVADALGY